MSIKKNINQMFNMSRFMYIIAFVLLFLPTSDPKSNFSPLLHIIALSIIIYLVFKEKIRVKKFSINRRFIHYFGVWLVFFIGLALSVFVNQDIVGVRDYTIVFIFYFFIIPQSDLQVSDMAIASVIAGLYVVYRCYFELGVQYTYYDGTSINSNQFALIMISGCLGAAYLVMRCSHGFFRFVYFVVAVLFFAFMAFSSSRNAVAVYAVCVFIIFFHVLLNHSSYNYVWHKFKVKNTYKLWVGIILFVFFAYLLLVYRESVLSFFFNKWANGIADITSGRTEIWKQIFNSMRLLGNHASTLNAHNDAIECLELYGIIPFIAYLIILIMVLYDVFMDYKKKRTVEHLFSLLIVMSFIMTGFFEIVFAAFGKPINIMFWCVAGLSLRVSNTS